jgi:hypothetical protein
VGLSTGKGDGKGGKGGKDGKRRVRIGSGEKVLIPSGARDLLRNHPELVE